MDHPRLCPHVTWKSNASTPINVNSSVSNLSALFIDFNDRIYLADQSTNNVSIYSALGVLLTQINSSQPTSLFVYGNLNILIGSNQSIDLFQPPKQSPSFSINVSEPCRDLFVDQNETVYCSLREQHRVIALSLAVSSAVEEYSVGSGTCGSTSIGLCFPTGLYVNNELNLYVVDTNNDRIQLFKSRSLEGITIVGTGASMSMNLSRPTALIPDGIGTLFILDRNNRRIVHYFWSGWRCVIGCSSDASESSSSALALPTHLAFDQRANLFVLDQGNQRIEKYQLEGNTCCE